MCGQHVTDSSWLQAKCWEVKQVHVYKEEN